MDMQDKLIINYSFRHYEKEIDLQHIKNGEILFTFNEYEPIEITLFSEKILVEIECLSYRKDKETIFCEDNVLKMTSGESYFISSSDNKEEIGYIPSKYQINFQINGTNINCLFEVRYNNELQEEGMDNIIEMINNYINGLSIDFFRNSPINNIRSTEVMSKYYMYEILKKYEKRIPFACDSILSNLRSNIEITYKNEKIEKKQNYVTIKKNILNKNKTSYYNVKKSITFNNEGNILLKKYLLEIIKILNRNYLYLDYELNEKYAKRKELEQEINIERYRYVENAKSISSKNFIQNHIKSLKSQNENNDQWILKLLSWKKSYEKVKYHLNHLLQSSELIDINIANNQILFSNIFYTNTNYHFFKEMYDTLNLRLSSKRKFNNSELFTDKKSYTLFEIYGFILLQNILKELGFYLINDLKTDVFSFDSDTIMHYTDGNLFVDIYYDHFCNRYDASDDNEVVSINSKNCKPDYIIVFFDKDHNFKDMVIVEMKYRRLVYMAPSINQTTETDTTIDDYSQLVYCVSKKDTILKRPPGAGAVVVILYPSIDEKIFKRNLGEFIGINAQLNFEDSSAYNRIKDIIFSKINKI